VHPIKPKSVGTGRISNSAQKGGESATRIRGGKIGGEKKGFMSLVRGKSANGKPCGFYGMHPDQWPTRRGAYTVGVSRGGGKFENLSYRGAAGPDVKNRL